MFRWNLIILDLGVDLARIPLTEFISIVLWLVVELLSISVISNIIFFLILFYIFYW